MCGIAFSCKIINVVRNNAWCPRCSAKKNRAICRLISTFDQFGIKYILEENVTLSGRNLKWDVMCNIDGVDFCVESDGAQHFNESDMNKITRRKLSKKLVRAKFQDQRTRDLLKEKHIRDTNGLLFRFSYRQTAHIESLVAQMLEHAANGTTGVVYMDSIYWDT